MLIKDELHSRHFKTLRNYFHEEKKFRYVLLIIESVFYGNKLVIHPSNTNQGTLHIL